MTASGYNCDTSTKMCKKSTSGKGMFETLEECQNCDTCACKKCPNGMILMLKPGSGGKYYCVPCGGNPDKFYCTTC